MNDGRDGTAFTIVTIATALTVAVQAPTRPGSALAPALELTYLSGADTQPVWTVDSVALDQAHQGRSGCSRIVQRMGGGAQTHVLCRAGDTLFSWNARTNQWGAQRPLAPGIVVTRSSPSGGRTTFEAGEKACTAVGDARLMTIHTTVLSTDSTGRPMRRLREQYAPSLATATGGTFEVRDGEGWKVDREFRLVVLAYPVKGIAPQEC